MKKMSLFLVAISFLTSVVSYPLLPETVPSHWNLQGEVDAYSSRTWGSLFFPLFALGLSSAFSILPKIDPKKEKYSLFLPEWQIIQTGIIGFFVYLHLVTTFVALNPDQEFVPLLLAGLGTLFILLGNYLSKIRQNFFLGIRLPWTLASDENWNLTHRFASWCYVLTGLVILITAIFQWHIPLMVFSSLGLMIVLPALYSFWLHYKRKMK